LQPSPVQSGSGITRLATKPGRASRVARSQPRCTLEALAAEEYKRGRLTKPDLRRLLGFETGDQIDEFLKEHEVFEDYTLEDLEREREGLQRLGF
jgi:hypothetical protein